MYNVFIKRAIEKIRSICVKILLHENSRKKITKYFTNMLARANTRTHTHLYEHIYAHIHAHTLTHTHSNKNTPTSISKMRPHTLT